LLAETHSELLQAAQTKNAFQYKINDNIHSEKVNSFIPKYQAHKPQTILVSHYKDESFIALPQEKLLIFTIVCLLATLGFVRL
jgi:capsule polysaccharide modification protein KpsS